MAESLLTRSWQYLALRGVAGVAFGVLAMAAPVETVIALALLWGIWALFDGVGTLIQAFRSHRGPARWTLVLTGVVSLVAAFFAIVRPGLSAEALTWVLGIWLVLRGLLEITLSVVDRVESRWGMILSGLVDIVLGALFMANPGFGAVSIAVVLGLTALVWGIVLCALAFWVHRSAPRSVAYGSSP